MDEPELGLILQKCLDALDGGESPATVAQEYPRRRDELLPLLDVAARLREGSRASPVPLEFLRDLGARLRSA